MTSGWAFFAVAVLAGSAAAHERSQSFSSWEIHGREATVRLRVSALDLSRLAPPGEAGAEPYEAYVARMLALRAAEAPCPVAGPVHARERSGGQVTFEWSVRCPEAGELRLHGHLFEESSVTHLHFARVRRDGRALEERVLSDRERVWAIGGDEGEGTSVAGYVRLGLEHILGGYDHVAFLVALLLGATTLGGVIRVVTGFTIAHSLTLALSVTGRVSVEPAPIEALIGLSIALVAAENLWLAGARERTVPAGIASLLAVLALAATAGWGSVPAVTLGGLALFTLCYFGLLSRSRRPEVVRGTVAFLFGLLHGFGFAAVLIEAELAPARLARALFGFNVGVEIGQLAIVAVLWLALQRAFAGRRRAVVEIGSVSVLALGTFWFVLRAFA